MPFRLLNGASLPVYWARKMAGPLMSHARTPPRLAGPVIRAFAKTIASRAATGQPWESPSLLSRAAPMLSLDPSPDANLPEGNRWPTLALSEADLAALAALDTPTICNALSWSRQRGAQLFHDAPAGLRQARSPPIVGYARTATIRAMQPADEDAAGAAPPAPRLLRPCRRGPGRASW